MTDLIRALYDRFNARDIDGVLGALAPDVLWANGMDGGHVRGHEAIREYWTRQWSEIDPHVDPLDIVERQNGSATVDVHQVVRDLEGATVLDERVTHCFRTEDGLVTRFDIEGPTGLSDIGH